MKARTFILATIITAALAVSGFAAIVTPVDPTPVTYDGACTISAVYATSTWQTSGLYANNGSFNFNCTGTFYGRITAKLFLEDPNEIVCSPDGTCSGATFASTSKNWPVMGYSCSTFLGMTQCIQVVKEAKPVNATMSLAPVTSRQKFTSHAIVEWVSGPCTTFLGYTTCPMKSVTMSKTTRTLIAVTN